MIIFTEECGPTYKYTEYASTIKEKCCCGSEIKVTGKEEYCNRKIKEFTVQHKKCLEQTGDYFNSRP